MYEEEIVVSQHSRSGLRGDTSRLCKYYAANSYLNDLNVIVGATMNEIRL